MIAAGSEPFPHDGRFWVRPLAPASAQATILVPHLSFTVVGAALRALRQAAEFAEYNFAMEEKRKRKGKKPKKGAKPPVPAMARGHVTLYEFAQAWKADPHVATPFLPYVARRYVLAEIQRRTGVTSL
jgi:hypothetical protein